MRICAELWEQACCDLKQNTTFEIQQLTTPAILNSFTRACSWPLPKNWSRTDWADELRQAAVCSGVTAVRKHSEFAHVPLQPFVYQMVIGHLLSAYRREWRFSVRCCGPLDHLQLRIVAEKCEIHAHIREAVACLPEAQRIVIFNLFWSSMTEAEIGKLLGLTQAAVNIRKRNALGALRKQFR